jgi:hypothetical protein
LTFGRADPPLSSHRASVPQTILNNRRKGGKEEGNVPLCEKERLRS